MERQNLMLPFLPRSESRQSSVAFCQHEQLQLFFGPKLYIGCLPFFLYYYDQLHCTPPFLPTTTTTVVWEDPAQCSSPCTLPGKAACVCVADPETEASPIRVMISHAWLECRCIIRSVGADGWLSCTEWWRAELPS